MQPPFEERIWIRNDDGAIIGEIAGGCLVIKARRHGKKSVTIVPLTEVLKWAGWTAQDGWWREGTDAPVPGTLRTGS